MSRAENEKALDMESLRMDGNFNISASNDFRQSPEERKGMFGAERNREESRKSDLEAVGRTHTSFGGLNSAHLPMASACHFSIVSATPMLSNPSSSPT